MKNDCLGCVQIKMDEDLIDLTKDENVVDLTEGNDNVVILPESLDKEEAFTTLGSNNKMTFLKEHQIAVLKAIKNMPGLLAVHRTGSGKTILGLSVRKQLGYLWKPIMKVGKLRHRFVYTLVVAPKKVVEQYKGEVVRFGLRLKAFKFVNYETLRNEEVFEECKKFLGHSPFSLLIFDEAHRLSNTEAALTSKALELSVHAKFVLCTTATPIVNSQADLSPLLALITREKLLPLNPEAFVLQFREQDGFVSNRQKLQDAFLNRVSVFTEIPEDEKKFYPRVTFVTERVRMSKMQLDVYTAIEEKNLSKLKDVFNADGTLDESKLGKINAFMTKTRQLCNSVSKYAHVPIDRKSSPKMFDVLDYVKSHAKPAVVFSHFIEGGCNILEEILTKSGLKFGVITGSSKSSPKVVVEEYNAGKLDVLVLSAAGSEGLDLKNTRQIHVVDQPWTDKSLQQVIGRGIRYKSHEALPLSERTCTVVQWISDKTESSTLSGGGVFDFLPANLRKYMYGHSKPSSVSSEPKVKRARSSSPKRKIPKANEKTLPTADELLMKINKRKRELTDTFMGLLECASIETNKVHVREKSPKCDIVDETPKQKSPEKPAAQKETSPKKAPQKQAYIRKSKSPDRKSKYNINIYDKKYDILHYKDAADRADRLIKLFSRRYNEFKTLWEKEVPLPTGTSLFHRWAYIYMDNYWMPKYNIDDFLRLYMTDILADPLRS